MAKKVKGTLHPGMHEIKNKKRPHAVRRKRQHLHLEGKRRHRVAKLVASLCAVAVIGLGAFFINAFFFNDVGVADTSRSASIAIDPPTDGTTPLDYDDPGDGSVYKGIENFAFINGKFRARKNWSLEMHGTTVAGVMGINVDQSVNTWKQYSDDILISVDITTSSMVNAARQFCYVGDSVIWREAKCKPAEYNGLETPWPDDDPFGHLTLEDFKKSYGLPASELSVYVVSEENVLYAEKLVDNGDGTYTQTWHLDPGDEKAPYFYRYQMQKTGNLTGLPTFYEITITYTFDSSWTILESDISESCNAPMGVSANCDSTFHTVYRYDEESCSHTAYDDYFYRYADKPATGEQEHELTATDCLSQAFESFTSGSPVLDLDLDINGTRLKGVLNLTIGDEIDVKARLGNIDIWYAGNSVYLKYGEVKAKLSVPELMGLVQGLLPADGNADLGADLDLTAILGQLVEDGEFTLGEETASLKSKLSLFGLTLPVNFDFIINEDKTVSLGKVSTSISISDTFAIGAGISFGNTVLPALTESDKQSFVELVPYAEQLITLFTSDYLHADIGYENEELGLYISGGVDVSLTGGIKASGTINVTYGEAEKQLVFGYTDGAVYLNLDGVKVSADVNGAKTLITSFLSFGDDAGGFDLSALLNKVFTDEFANNLSLTEVEAEEMNSLQLAVLGTELLKAFGVNFDLGNIVIGVANETVSVTALGAVITVSAGSDFEPDTAGYTELVTYADDVIDLVNSEYLEATVSYASGGLSVLGTVNVSTANLKVLATLNLSYGSINKDITVIYKEGQLYLSVDSLRVKLNTEEAIDMVTDLLMPKDEANDDIKAILDKVFSFNFGEVIVLGKVEDALSVTLKSTAILEAFGVDFNLGTVTVGVEQGKLTASALGADITVTVGEEFKTDIVGKYIDISPVVAKIPAVIRAEGISFSGNIQLTAGDTEVILSVNHGALSWANGIAVYLDATIEALGSTHDLLLSYADGVVTLVYGEVGVRIVISDLSDLEKAFVKVYDRVRDIVGKALSEGTENPLPVIKKVKDLLGLLKGGEALSGTLGDILGGVLGEGDGDWTDFLADLTLGEPVSTNGIFTISLMGFTVEVLSELEEGDLLALTAGYSTEDLSVSASLSAAANGEKLPAMPEDIDYLGVADFADLLDYLGATVALLAEEHLNLKIEGSVTSMDAAYDAYNHVKYDITGDIHYYSGGGFPFELDVNGKTLTVSTDLFLQVSFKMVAYNPEDNGLYLDITVIDADLDGKKDDVLDFYVTVSMVGEGNNGYDPLRLYAPSDEIMTVLAGVCVMFDIDLSILNDYLINKWLTAEQSAQLKGLGDSLKLMIGDLMNLFGSSDSEESAEGSEELQAFSETLDEALGHETRRGIITSLVHSKGSFTLALDSSVLFGQEGLDPLRITISKEEDDAGNTYLTGASVHNIYSNGGVEKTSIGLSVSRTKEVDAQRPTVSGWFSVEAVDTLIFSLAKSTTHGVNEKGEIISGEEKPHHYTLNTNFFINGSATLDLSVIGINLEKIKINIRAISVNIDEEGEVGINIRLEYDGVYNLLAGIMGDRVIIKGHTILDATIKNTAANGMMLYMKRTQTSEFDGSKEKDIKPIVIYRALPLANFGKCYMNQICFMFNFSEDLMNRIMGMVGDGSNSDNNKKEAPIDIGGIFNQYVSSCSYVKNGTSDQWTLNINGSGLLGDSFGDIVVTVGTDSEGYLRSITANMAIAGIVKVDAELTYRNPAGIMDAGVSDTSENIAGVLEAAMDRKLKTVDWTTTDFLEGQLATVRYFVGDELIDDTQSIVYVPTTKELYGDFNYPNLAAYLNAIPGYTPGWSNASAYFLGANVDVYAGFTANTYTLVFESDRAAAGYEFDNLTNKWVKRIEWTFDTELELPYAADERARITGFVCPEGDLHTAEENAFHFFGKNEIRFTAQWETLEYTVTFVVDGETYATASGNYGGEVAYPADPEKVGYTFVGWDIKVDTFTENCTVTAIFTANIYEVTLVSEYEISGFGWNGEAYEKIINFTYDEKYALPADLRTETAVLKGWMRAGDDTHYIDFLPNVVEKTTFTAIWEMLGYDIRFVDYDGTVTVRNRLAGYKFTAADLPAILGSLNGYTLAWNIDLDSYTVTKDDTIYTTATPITYTVTVVSDYPVNGFTQADGVWTKAISYVYDRAAVTLPSVNSAAVSGYDFDAYYSAPNGGGTKVTAINASVIGDIFGWSESDNVLYANWVDNSVTVTLYSDYDFVGSQGRDGVSRCYYMGYTLKDGNYNIEKLTLNTIRTDVQFMGWWYLDPATGMWRNVVDIKEFMALDRAGTPAKIYAMWVENIIVTMTEMNESTGSLSTYKFGGHVTGGDVLGLKSSEIFHAIGATKSVVGDYKIYNNSGSEDPLKYGATVTIDEDGNFFDSGMTSGKSFLWGGATYGGVTITVTFTYKDVNGKNQTVSTHWDAAVSYKKYAVNFVDKNGSRIYSREVRLDCPYDDCDNAARVRDLVDDSILSRFGYTYSLSVADDMRITGATTIVVSYTPNSYGVTFVSSEYLGEGWVREGTGSEFDGYYVYRTLLEYGSTVSFWANGAQIEDFGGVVGANADENVFYFPEKPKFQGIVEGEWNAVIKAGGATFTVVYDLDTVTYHSEIAFLYEGVSTNSATYQFTAEMQPNGYTLVRPQDVVVDSITYTFLGWYVQKNGVWEEVSSVAATAEGEESLNLVVEALWMGNNWMTISASKNSGAMRNYSVSVTINDSALVGAFAGELTRTSESYYYNLNSSGSAGSYGKATTSNIYSDTTTLFTNHSNAHAKATVSYTDNSGKTWTYTQERHATM